MSKKTNPAAVGIFVVGAVVILLAGLILLGAGQMFEKKGSYVIYIQSDANGLEVGSDVLLAGVKVGSVQNMMVQFDPNTKERVIPIVIDLSADRLSAISVDKKYDKDDILGPDALREFVEEFGLKARLKSKSALTGQLYVDLAFFPEEVKEGKFGYTFPGKTIEGLQQIPSTKNEIERVLETVADSVKKLSDRDIGTQFDKLVAKVDAAVAKAETLFDTINSKVADLDTKGISDKANSSLAKIDALLGDEKIQSTVASIDEAAAELKDLLAAIDAEAVNGAVVDAQSAIQNAGDTIANAGDALKKIELAAGNIAANTSSDAALTVRLARSLGAIEEVSRSIKELTDYLKRNPNSILAGKKRP